MENVSMTLKFAWQILQLILWNGLKIWTKL